MRTIALAIIILSEILILALLALDFGASSLSMVSTLVAVVVAAFAASALLRNIKSMKLSRNYIISGICGVIVGIAYYLWAKENLEAMVHWLKEYGVYVLMVIILVCSLILYFSNRKKETTPSTVSDQ